MSDTQLQETIRLMYYLEKTKGNLSDKSKLLAEILIGQLKDDITAIQNARTFCIIREDLIKKGDGVPIVLDGETSYILYQDQIEYRNLSDDRFEIYHDGDWYSAYTIDFDL